MIKHLKSFWMFLFGASAGMLFALTWLERDAGHDDPDASPQARFKASVLNTHGVGCALPPAIRDGVLHAVTGEVEGGVSVACSEDRKELDESPADTERRVEQAIEDGAAHAEQIVEDVEEALEEAAVESGAAANK